MFFLYQKREVVPLTFKHMLSSIPSLMECASVIILERGYVPLGTGFRRNFKHTDTPLPTWYEFTKFPLCLDLSLCTSIAFCQETVSSGATTSWWLLLGNLSPSQPSTLRSVDFFSFTAIKLPLCCLHPTQVGEGQ